MSTQTLHQSLLYKSVYMISNNSNPSVHFFIYLYKGDICHLYLMFFMEFIVILKFRWVISWQDKVMWSKIWLSRTRRRRTRWRTRWGRLSGWGKIMWDHIRREKSTNNFNIFVEHVDFVIVIFCAGINFFCKFRFW